MSYDYRTASCLFTSLFKSTAGLVHESLVLLMRIISSKCAVDLSDTVLAAQDNSPYALLAPSSSSLTPSPLPFGHLASLTDGSIVNS